MPLLAIILILVAASFHVLRDLMTKQAKEKLVFVWWMSALSLLMLSPVCIYFLIKTQPSLHAILFALAMGFVHASYWTLHAKAYEKGDISHVYPIMRSAPAFVLIFAVLFLHERPDTLGILGILGITLGLYCINLKKLTWEELFSPIQSIFREEHTRFAFLALIFVTVYSLLDKVAVSQMNPLVYAFVMIISALAIFSLYIHKHLKRAGLHPIQKESECSQPLFSQV